MHEKNMIDWFVKGGFFGKICSQDEPFNMSVQNDDDLLLAVKKAYIDMTPRTISGLKKARENDVDFSNSINNLLGELRDEFIKFFNNLPNNQALFDYWHEKQCENFKNSFNRLLSKKQLKEIEYGKAQKIVNMTFKYLYCFDDAKDECFEFCHMALDKYTIEWFCDEVLKWWNNNNKDKKMYKKDIESWSNLKKGKADEKGTYLWIQNQIKEYLKTQNQYPKVPMIAEFTIWQKYKKKELNKPKAKQENK